MNNVRKQIEQRGIEPSLGNAMNFRLKQLRKRTCDSGNVLQLLPGEAGHVGAQTEPDQVHPAPGQPHVLLQPGQQHRQLLANDPGIRSRLHVIREGRPVLPVDADDVAIFLQINCEISQFRPPFSHLPQTSRRSSFRTPKRASTSCRIRGR